MLNIYNSKGEVILLEKTEYNPGPNCQSLFVLIVNNPRRKLLIYSPN